MPQIAPTNKEITPYGVTPNDNTMSFQERCMKLFAAHEYVTVQNVDSEAYIWQYMPAHEEEFEYTPDPMKITRRGQPEMWMLDAGESETIVGANAYIMMEGLFKKLAAKKKMADTPEIEGQARNFSFSDGEQQSKWISKIYVGKAAIPFQAPTTPAQDLNIDREAINASKELVGVTTPKKN